MPDPVPDLALTTLDDLAVIAVRGADAVSFLHGQLSQDVTRLADGGAQLAGLHNAQGRCLAVLRVLRAAPEQLLLVLPAELADATRQLLSRYVLRARARIEDASPAWRACGLTGADAASAARRHLSMPMDSSGHRQLIVTPRGEPLPDAPHASRERWRLDDIRAGLPEIGAATAGLFVAQMLNLDLLDGISFSKGCYTGQEIIARAHYRGQVKRRMQRFATSTQARLAPGARVTLADGRSAQLVMAAAAGPDGQEFLAVTSLPAAAGVGDTQSAGDGAELQPALACTQLPLPYALPA